jgi:DNA mismatch repair protein MutS
MAPTVDISARYSEIKKENPGAMLLFRMGDFYELFHDDAVQASKVLGLTLTYRNKGTDEQMPMAGFPYHQLDACLAKLIKSGFRAAICDQVPDPKNAKGLVRRENVRVVKPAVSVMDELNRIIDDNPVDIDAIQVPETGPINMDLCHVTQKRKRK